MDEDDLRKSLQEYVKEVNIKQGAGLRTSERHVLKGRGEGVMSPRARKVAGGRFLVGGGLVHYRPPREAKTTWYEGSGNVPAAGCTTPLNIAEERKEHRLHTSTHSYHVPTYPNVNRGSKGIPPQPSCVSTPITPPTPRTPALVARSEMPPHLQHTQFYFESNEAQCPESKIIPTTPRREIQSVRSPWRM
eukprot:TRINITY_DN11637_c1_g1_i1.p1 TRINITY_DN11637_c1_g1~~TRINITY_DN11637_c1_g1_i1.p1  ORF type:complete len:190 (+),score=16.98 TRINITY_DN11637_c1_g1_i1:67-636(+)